MSENLKRRAIGITDAGKIIGVTLPTFRKMIPDLENAGIHAWMIGRRHKWPERLIREYVELHAPLAK